MPPQLPKKENVNNLNSKEDNSTLSSILHHFPSLTNDIVIYGFGGALSSLLSLFTAPILTRIFTVSEYGVVDIITITVGFSTLLLGINLTTGMWRYFYEISLDEQLEKKRLVSSTIWLIVAIGIPMTSFLLFIAAPVSKFLFGSQLYSTVLQIAILTVPVRLFQKVFMEMQRMRRRPARYMFLNLTNLAIIFIFTILFVVILEMGLKGIFIAQFVGFGITAAIGLLMGKDLLILSFSWPWLKKVASYSIPLLPGVFTGWFLLYANRFFLNFYTDTQQVGYLSVAHKVSNVLVLFTSSFLLAWHPFAFSIIARKNFRKVYSRSLDYYLAITFLIAAGLTVFSSEALTIITPSAYWAAAPLVGILLFRHVIHGANQIVGIGIAVSKKTIYSSIGLTIGAIFTVLANLTLTKQVGVPGAALAEAAGFLVVFAAYYAFSMKVFPIQWNIGNALGLTSGYVLLSIGSIVLPFEALHWTMAIAFKLMILSVYAIFVLSRFDREERAVIKQAPQWVIAKIRSFLLPVK